MDGIEQIPGANIQIPMYRTETPRRDLGGWVVGYFLDVGCWNLELQSTEIPRSTLRFGYVVAKPRRAKTTPAASHITLPAPSSTSRSRQGQIPATRIATGL